MLAKKCLVLTIPINWKLLNVLVTMQAAHSQPPAKRRRKNKDEEYEKESNAVKQTSKKCTINRKLRKELKEVNGRAKDLSVER